MATQQDNLTDLANGLAEAAAELGNPYYVYRPTLTALVRPIQSPLTVGNLVATILADFPRNYGYRLPIDPTKPQRVAVLDPRLVQVGDYIASAGLLINGQPITIGSDPIVSIDDDSIYFIAAEPVLAPMSAIVCNRYVSLYSQSQVGQAGQFPIDAGQLGNVFEGPASDVTQLLQNYPASVLYAGRGSRSITNLPTDDTLALWSILLPPLPITLTQGDIIEDDTGRRFSVLAAENNASGVRFLAMQQAAA